MWCDVVRLKGGDDFWRDIENAIRQHTQRFVFVVSKESNQKQGTLQELSVASGIARQLNDTGFIIPGFASYFLVLILKFAFPV